MPGTVLIDPFLLFALFTYFFSGFFFRPSARKVSTRLVIRSSVCVNISSLSGRLAAITSRHPCVEQPDRGI